MTCRRPATTVRSSFPRVSACAFGLLLSLFGFAGTSRAQSGAASISGTITDRSGALVPGAELAVVNTDTDSKFDTKTNGAGVYQVPFLKPGHYRIVVTKQGFKQIDLRDVTLNVQDSVNRNFTLDLGATSETVQVNGSGINVNTTDAAVSTVIDRQFVENMPLNGRSFQSLLTLAPGVSIAASSAPFAGQGVNGGIVVNGQRTEANYFTVDGVGANTGTNPYVLQQGLVGNGAGFSGATPAGTALGTTQSLVSIDALQEFRATTSTYSSEYGRTPGGQFSFATRSGTNDWHGSAFDYLRNEAMDANNWFNDYYGYAKEKERQNDFGGTLGGPVTVPGLYGGKDKTFFFFSYEGLRLWTPQGVIQYYVPDATFRGQVPAALQPIVNAFALPNAGEDAFNDGLGIYRQAISNPSTIDSVSVRVDHSFSDQLKIFGRYSNTPSAATSYTQGFATPEAINARTLTIGSTYLVTPAQSNEFRFNITQNVSVYSWESTNMGGATPFTSSDFAKLPGLNGGSFPAVGSNLAVYPNCDENTNACPQFLLQNESASQRQYNVLDTYTWNMGTHSFKFGVDWRRLTTFTKPTLLNEYVLFESEASAFANTADFAVASASSSSPVEPLYRNFSAFAQDEWRATGRLSISVGLRWELDPPPGNLDGPSPYTVNQITDLATTQLASANTPLWHTTHDNFAPRLGIAYQVNQAPAHETVVRAGVGMFYDLNTQTGSQGFGGVGFAQTGQVLSGVPFPLTSAQLVLSSLNDINPPYGGSSGEYVYAFDPNLMLPYTLQWNLSIQQALGRTQSLTVGYVASAGRKLLSQFQYLPNSLGNPNFVPDYGYLYVTSNRASSDYNSLQVEYQKSISRGLQALASYTFSHSIDDASSNFLIYELERASSDFDIRHNFQAAFTYDVAGAYKSPVVSAILKNWSFDIRISARSALPVDVVASSGVDPTTGAQRNFHPDRVPGVPLYVANSQAPGGRLINFNAFTYPVYGQPGYGEEGDAGRNAARDFGAWQTDVAIRRAFPLTERLKLQFRAEAFNVFNHPSFSGINSFWCPTCNWTAQNPSGFGTAKSTLNSALGGLNPLYQIGGPRSLQIALKLIF